MQRILRYSKYIFPIFIILSIIINPWFGGKNKKLNYSLNLSCIDSLIYCDTKYLMIHSSMLYYSCNADSCFRLFKYCNNYNTKIIPNIENVFSPFSFDNNICALQDYNGNEEYKITNNGLRKYLGNKSVDNIYSSPNGNIIVVKIKNDHILYLINTLSKTLKPLCTIKYKLHAVIFDPKNNEIFISLDKKLLHYDISKQDSNELCEYVQSEKLNLYLNGNTLYFVSNYSSEYFNIYKINYKIPHCEPIIVLSSSHDIRIPKVVGSKIYYIEVINSQYLLKVLDLANHRTSTITENGVVFNYEIFNKNKLLILYSDYEYPISIWEYDINTRKIKYISGKRMHGRSTYHFQKKTLLTSPAFYLMPNNQKDLKGIILYFHQGLNSDYSPRWDAILNSLANNGYCVIIPNYPMSTGYGKSFMNETLNDAVTDILSCVFSAEN